MPELEGKMGCNAVRVPTLGTSALSILVCAQSGTLTVETTLISN